MEITDVTVHPLSTAGVEAIGDGTQDAAVIEVETDEGITGVGEADSSPAVVESIVEAPTSHVKARGLEEILLGRDPFDVEVLWEEMFEATYFFGRKGAAINAISGVDMALWDIKGKATGKPLYKLLGGAHRDSARAYASTLFPEDPTDTEAVLEAAERVRDDGFTAAKFGWGAIGDDPRADHELVGAAREGLGPDADLMVDVGNAWDDDVKGAIREVQALDEAHDLYWVEEPVRAENIRGYARISEHCRTRIVGGEEEYTTDGFRTLLDDGRVDAVQPDVARSGGITQLRRIARMAADCGVPFIPHGFSTDIIVAANLHLIAAAPNASLLEYCIADSPLRWNVVEEEFPVVDGRVEVPTEPGLGVTLDRATLSKYATDH